MGWVDDGRVGDRRGRLFDRARGVEVVGLVDRGTKADFGGFWKETAATKFTPAVSSDAGGASRKDSLFDLLGASRGT